MNDIQIPKDTESVLKDFKEDLRMWRSKISKEINDITEDEKYREKLKKIYSNKANYDL